MTSRTVITCALFLLLLAALYLRTALVLGTEVDIPLRADAGDYATYATNLVDHGVYSVERWVGEGEYAQAPQPDAFRNPGYPWFLTVFLREDITVARFVLDVSMVQALIGTLTVLLVFLLARALVGSMVALVPAALTAVNPHQLAFTTHVLTETVYTALVVLFVLLLVRAHADRNRSAAGWIWAGLALGASVLVRPTLMHLPLLMVVVVMATMPWRKGLAVVGCLLLGFGLMTGPWFARNAVVIGQMTDPRLTIAALHHGSYPDFRFEDRPETQDFPYRFDPESPQISASTGSAVAHIIEQFESKPWPMLRWYLFGKPLAFFSWNVGQSDDAIMQYPTIRNPFGERPGLALLARVMQALHWPLILFALLVTGASLATRRISAAGTRISSVRWIGMVLLFAIAVHVVGAPFGRYSVPFMPLVYVLAAFGAMQGARWLSTRMPRKSGGTYSAGDSTG